MAWIRAMGGGSNKADGKPHYNPKINRAYLYKDGNITQKTKPLYTNGMRNVEWDNTGYSIATGYNNLGGFTLNGSNMTAYASASESRCIVTQDKVDVTDMDWLCMSWEGGTLRVNVTNYSGEYYVMAFLLNRPNLGICITPTKVNGFNSKVAYAWNTNNASEYLNTHTVTRIWLEQSVAKATDKDAVDWDNRGYAPNTSTTADGGFSLSDVSMSADVTTNAHARAILTDKGVDLSEYSTLKVTYNGSSTLSLDKSSIKSSAYVYACNNNTSSAKQLIIGATPTKENFNSNRYGNNAIATLSSTSVIVNRVWLEK